MCFSHRVVKPHHFPGAPGSEAKCGSEGFKYGSEGFNSGCNKLTFLKWFYI
jgi:hypothetical protein